MSCMNIIHSDANNILFFDMDGTLVDTDYANYLAYHQAIELVIGRKQLAPCDNQTRFDKSALVKFYPQLNAEEYQAIIQLKGRLYEDFLSETRLNEDLAKALCQVSDKRQTVLVTNANRARAMLTLEHHGIVDYFNHLFFGECCINAGSKYENALQSLGVDLDNVIIFENDLNEITKVINLGVNQQNIIHIQGENFNV